LKILLLNESGPLGLKVLYCIHAMGVYVETAGPAGSKMLGCSRYSRHHTLVDLWCDQNLVLETLDWLYHYVEVNSFDIVVPSDIGSAAFLAVVRNSSGQKIKCFPCSSMEVLNNLHNKWEFAKICYQLELPTPETILLEPETQLEEELFYKIGFPLIVKPIERESGHGVIKLNNYSSLLEYVRGNTLYSEFPLIAQSFIPGQDIDISVLSADGEILCNTVQSWINDGVLRFSGNNDMYEIVAKIIENLSFEGLAHFDMRIDARTNKLYVFECNPRAWYTISASMWQGLNFIEAGVTHTLEGSVNSINNGFSQDNFCLPGSFMKQLFLPFTGWKNISIESTKAFFQAVTDPLPHIVSKIN
jgi:ATP-grasp domain